ncbi:MAG: cadR [Polaromonas sp.]|jgi:Cd(II)/Pb(II)-responsive transcriptional regulator|nr:cadR [Polaromonas sp.]
MKIGEIAKLARTQAETIRYYEREGLLPEATRSDANYRVYEASHVSRLAFIRHCRSLDMTLAEIRTLLRFRDAPGDNCGEVNLLLEAHIGHVAARIRELRGLEKELKLLREQCTSAQAGPACGILGELDKAAKAPRAARAGLAPAHVRGSHGRMGAPATSQPGVT